MTRCFNSAGTGRGVAHVLDPSYEVVRTLTYGGASAGADLHEFRLIHGSAGDDQPSALLTQYRLRPADFSHHGVAGLGWLHDSVFQEQRLSDGAVTFEWAASDHIALNESTVPFLKGRTPREPWDYFHINSVEKLPGGDYLVSSRYTSTIYRISGQDGTVTWRLGGQNSDFALLPASRGKTKGQGTGEDEGWFRYQHDARLLSNESGILTLSLFDNGRTVLKQARPFSRGLVLTVDERARTASVRAQYHHPATPRKVPLAGSMRVLDNGNVLVGWGSTGCLAEYTADNRPVLEACLWDRPRPGFYRVHKTAAWRGRPRTRPAIAAFSPAAAAGTAVHLSWNGATEVARWAVYGSANATGADARWQALGAHARAGFETTVVLPDHWPVVRAEALDADGHVLATSAAARTFTPSQLHDGCDDTWCFPLDAVAEPPAAQADMTPVAAAVAAVAAAAAAATMTQTPVALAESSVNAAVLVEVAGTTGASGLAVYTQLAAFAVLALGMGSLVSRRLRMRWRR